MKQAVKTPFKMGNKPIHDIRKEEEHLKKTIQSWGSQTKTSIFSKIKSGKEMLNNIQNVSTFTSLLTEKKKLYEKVSTNMIGYIGSLKD